MSTTKPSLLLAFLLLGVSLTSCQMLGIKTADLGILPASVSHRFLVTSTTGVVQVRESFEDPWSFLTPGGAITTEHYIRTGMNASADLVLINGGDDIKVKIHANMPEMELYDAYKKLLCPKGYAKYLRQRAEKGQCVDHREPVAVCRSTMLPAKENDFLAVANVTLDLKNSSAVVGGAAASAGGTSGPGC